MQASDQPSKFLDSFIGFFEGLDIESIIVKIALCIAIYIVGSWLIKRLLKTVEFIMKRREYEASLQIFLKSLLSWVLKILLILAILGTLGVETTSFAAIVGAAGLAIGLALKNSLGNFAGGVLILIFKPFKVGDFIEAQGLSGTVKEIGILNTKLSTFGNQIAIVPNGNLSNTNIINYSVEDTRRENITVGISYDSNIKQAKDILLDIVTTFDKVNKEPEPEVMVSELADSSVNLSLRYWATNANFWACRWHVLEELKTRFDAEGIEIPYPHQVEIQKQG